MGRRAAIVVLLATMIVVIVGLDVLIFRHRVWPRLLANIGVVLLFAAFYLRFLKHS